MIETEAISGELAIQRIDYMQPASEVEIDQMLSAAGDLIDPEKVQERTVELSTEWKQLCQIAEAMPIWDPERKVPAVFAQDVAKKLFGKHDLPTDSDLNDTIRSIQRSRPTERDYVVKDQFFQPPRGEFVTLSGYDSLDRPKNYPEGTTEKTLERVGSELTERLAHISALQTLRDDPNFHYTFALPEQGKHEYFTQKIADHIIRLQHQAYTLMQNGDFRTKTYTEWDGRMTNYFRIARTSEVRAAGASIMELAGEMAIHEASSYGAGFTPDSTAANTADTHPGVDLATSTVNIIGKIYSEADQACTSSVAALDSYYDPRQLSDPWIGKNTDNIKQQVKEQRLLRTAMLRLYEAQVPYFLDIMEYHAANIAAQLDEPARTERGRKEQQQLWPKAFSELKVMHKTARALTKAGYDHVYPKTLPASEPIQQTAAGIQELADSYLKQPA